MKKCALFLALSFSTVFGEIAISSIEEDAVISMNEEKIEHSILFPKKFARIQSDFEKKSDLSNLEYKEKLDLPKETYKSPAIAAILASVFPGLGHVYLGDYNTAGIFAGSIGVCAPTLFVPNRTIKEIDGYSLECAWFYNIYAAYRDARNYIHNSGYQYPMPNDSFKDLALAPFRFEILKKPQVWGGFCAKITAIVILSALFLEKNPKDNQAESLRSIPTPMIAFPVGIAEESLFRGYLQPQLSEYFTPWGGIALSSALFGAAHISNASDFSYEEKKRYYTFSIPFITLAGVYYGWLANENQSLQECVALHSWYDFILFGLAKLAKEQDFIVPVKNQFSITIPF